MGTKLDFEEVAPGDIPFTQADELPPPVAPKPKNTKLRGEILNTYTMLAMGIYPFDPYVGSLIAENADNCATAWDELARVNPKVKKALESLMQTSAYGAILAAHLPIAVAVATKYVPALRETYEAQFKAAQQVPEPADENPYAT